MEHAYTLLIQPSITKMSDITHLHLYKIIFHIKQQKLSEEIALCTC